jgi:hypothetical protein
VESKQQEEEFKESTQNGLKDRHPDEQESNKHKVLAQPEPEAVEMQAKEPMNHVEEPVKHCQSMAESTNTRSGSFACGVLEDHEILIWISLNDPGMIHGNPGMNPGMNPSVNE